HPHPTLPPFPTRRSSDLQRSASVHDNISGHGRDIRQTGASIKRNRVSLDANWNEQRDGWYRKTRTDQWLRTVEDRQRRIDCGIERSFRQRRLREAIEKG